MNSDLSSLPASPSTGALLLGLRRDGVSTSKPDNLQSWNLASVRTINRPASPVPPILPLWGMTAVCGEATTPLCTGARAHHPHAPLAHLSTSRGILQSIHALPSPRPMGSTCPYCANTIAQVPRPDLLFFRWQYAATSQHKVLETPPRPHRAPKSASFAQPRVAE